MGASKEVITIIIINCTVYSNVAFELQERLVIETEEEGKKRGVNMERGKQERKNFQWFCYSSGRNKHTNL